ncbi:MAG: hypothetical protein JZU65_14080 [Chlorobium sp.]|nr:hypothetical protein [Chlorobium sp.]
MISKRSAAVLYMTLIQFMVLPLSGCGGRTANPVKSVQVGDSGLSCDALRADMANVEAQVSALIPESKKTGKNVALATAGLFLIVPFFFIDNGDAEDAEIKAYRDRYGELQKMYAQKRCDKGGATESSPMGAKSTKDRLIELKELYDQKLIDESDYQKAKAVILTAE